MTDWSVHHCSQFRRTYLHHRLRGCGSCRPAAGSAVVISEFQFTIRSKGQNAVNPFISELFQLLGLCAPVFLGAMGGL